MTNDQSVIQILHRAGIWVFQRLRCLSWSGWAVTGAVMVGAMVMVLLANPLWRGALVPLLAQSQIPESQRVQMELAFSRQRLSSYQIRDGRVFVPRRERGTYLAALEHADAVPLSFRRVKQSSLEAGHIFESPSQQAARREQAREIELALAIQCMEGIEQATVRYDESPARGLRGEAIRKAVVGVVCQRGFSLDESTVHTIRRLVEGGYAGLDVNDVIVADLRARRVFAADDEKDASLLAYRKRQLEEDWTKKVRTVLNFIPDATIVVHATLAPRGDSATIANVGRSRAGRDSSIVVERIPHSRPRPPTQLASLGAADLTVPDPVLAIEPARLNIWVGIPRRHAWKLSTSPRRGTYAPVQQDAGQRIDRIEAHLKQQVRSAIAALLPDPLERSGLTVTAAIVDDGSPPPAAVGRMTGWARHWLSGGWLVMVSVAAGGFAWVLLAGRDRWMGHVRRLGSPWLLRHARASTVAESTARSTQSGDAASASTGNRVTMWRFWSRRSAAKSRLGSVADSHTADDIQTAFELRRHVAGLVQRQPAEAAQILSQWLGESME